MCTHHRFHILSICLIQYYRYIYFSVVICDTPSSYTWIFYFIHSICVSCTLWCCNFRYVKVDVSRVFFSLFIKTHFKTMKTFSMKLLSVTTKSRDPVLVPDASLFCDARKRIPSLFPSLLFFPQSYNFCGVQKFVKRSPKMVGFGFWIF